MNRRPHRHLATRRGASTTLALALAAGALVGTAVTPASAATTSVTTGSALASALSGCSDGDVVALGDDLIAGALPVGCSATLDLAGFTLSSDALTVAAGETLRISDSGTTGALNASATSGAAIGVTGAAVVIDGGRLTLQGGPKGAGIGGGPDQANGSVTIEGDAIVSATGGQGAGFTGGGAGIGGGSSAAGGTIVIRGDADVTATNGDSNSAGIGGGSVGDAGSITIGGNAQVTATAVSGAAIGGGSTRPGQLIRIQGTARVTATATMGAAIGGGSGASGGSITISGGTVSATALGPGNGEGPAAIGGGNRGNAGTVTISGDTTVTARGARLSAAIGAGRVGNGASTTITAPAVVTAFGGTAVGGAVEGATVGTLQLSGTLRLGDATTGTDLVLSDTASGDEVTILPGGRLEGGTTTATGSTVGAITGTGVIANAGVITLAPSRVASGVSIKDRHVEVTFDSRGGSAVPSTRVYADTFATGSRVLPTPTRAGFVFDGWNTATDGSGTTVTSTTTLPSGAPGTPVGLTLYAQWSLIPVAATITGPATATATAARAFSYTPTVGGVPAPTVTTDSALPPGVTLNATTGALTGTPTTTGTYPVTLVAANAHSSASLTVTITVDPTPVPPTISGASTARGTVGVPFSYTATMTGVPAPRLAFTGTRPPGMTLDAGAGTLGGTPTTAGTYPIELIAQNGQSPSARLPLTITIDPAPVAPTITGDPTGSGAVGQPYTYTPTLTGVPAPQVTASSLPPGLNLNATTGALSGVPTEAGTFPVTLTATNGSGSADLTVSFTFVRAAVVPNLDGPSTADGVVGTAFSYTPELDGVPAPVVTTTSMLPPGLTLDAATAAITGTPTEAGSYPVTLHAANSVGEDDLSVMITITPAPAAPTVTGPSSASAVVGTAFDYVPTLSGYPLPTVTTTSTLPPGLALASGTGALSGVPTTTGTFPITLTATNASGTADLTLTLTVRSVPTITGPATATATLGTPLRYTPTVSGSPAPTITTGSTLPPGVTLNATTGALTGTPTATGTYPVTLVATNPAGTADLTLTLTVGPPACSDGLDNDRNGATDFPQDLGCTTTTDTTETSPATASQCGTTKPLTGTARKDKLTGTDRADTVLALGGDDTLDTRAGNDCVYAGPGNDSVKTGTGDDRLNPGPGKDTVDAGAGDDHLVTADGTKDTLTCGPGTDTVIADRTDVLKGCERRTLTRGPATPSRGLAAALQRWGF